MRPYEEFSIDVRGQKISGAVGGNGPLIFFLHGIGLSWAWWKPTLEAVEDDYSWCAIDLPGWGESSSLATVPSSVDCRAMIEAVVGMVDRGDAVVVGHSLGGFVATQAAIANSTGIRAMILVAPFGFGPVRNPYFRLLSIPVLGDAISRTGAPGLRLLLRSLVHSPGPIVDQMLRQSDRSGRARKQFVHQIRLGIRWGVTLPDFLVSSPPSLAVPCTLLWGLHDSVFPISIAHKAKRILGCGSLTVFEQSGHFPQLEEPVLFNSVVRSFAKEVFE